MRMARQKWAQVLESFCFFFRKPKFPLVCAGVRKRQLHNTRIILMPQLFNERSWGVRTSGPNLLT